MLQLGIECIFVNNRKGAVESPKIRLDELIDWASFAGYGV